MKFNLQTRTLKENADGYHVWEKVIVNDNWLPNETALILCDVWDKHWSRGANERQASMLPRMNDIVKAARDKGVQIIHSPADTMDFYEGTPARKRVIGAPTVEPPTIRAYRSPDARRFL